VGRGVGPPMHEKLWKVSNELKGSEGLDWIKREFAHYDFKELEWITLRRGVWGGPGSRYDGTWGWTSTIHGQCQLPHHTRSGKYRINCNVNTRLGWPADEYQRVSPLYKNADGSWPEVPEGHVTGTWFGDPKTGQEWQRLYRLVPISTEDEAVVYIVAHEMFHYLRRTKQIEGRNTEIEADGFSLELLERYRESVRY
jgi:hypothetical protein